MIRAVAVLAALAVTGAAQAQDLATASRTDGSVASICANAADMRAALGDRAADVDAMIARPGIREIFDEASSSNGAARVACIVPRDLSSRLQDAGMADGDASDLLAAMLRVGDISDGRIWRFWGYDDCACLRRTAQ